MHEVSVCRTVPPAHGQPAKQVCNNQKRCKNATSGAYDAQLVAGCIDFGPPDGAQDELGDAISSRRALLSAEDSAAGHGPSGLPYWADTTCESRRRTASTDTCQRGSAR